MVPTLKWYVNQNSVSKFPLLLIDSDKHLLMLIVI